MNSAPFPDPQVPRPTAAAKRRGILTFVGMTLVGAAIGYGIAVGSLHWFDADPAAGRQTRFSADLWTAATLPLVFWICIVVHEVGHLLGGRIGGMRALMLIAGPLRLEFSAEGTRVLPNRVASTPLGLAVCAPPSGQSASRGRYVLLVAAGPLTSILFAGVAGLASFAIGGWWGGVLFVTAASSLVIGVVTLVPVRTGGYMSDGGQLVGLARRDDETRQRLALTALVGQSCTGVRPRDWDPDLFRALGEGSRDATLHAAAAALAAARADDQGDLDSADTCLRDVAGIIGCEQGASIAEAMRRDFALMVAAWIGHRRREGASARRWLEASRGGYSDPATTAYAESAVALAEGDREEARRQLEAALAALPRHPDRGSAVALADSLADIARNLDGTTTDITPSRR